MLTANMPYIIIAQTFRLSQSFMLNPHDERINTPTLQIPTIYSPMRLPCFLLQKFLLFYRRDTIINSITKEGENKQYGETT